MLALILVAIACLAAVTHRAQLNRRRSDERFTALVQNATDVITVLDREGVVRWESPSAERILGFAPGERCGMPASMTLHPADWDHARAVFAQLAGSQGTVLRLQARIAHANGDYSWCDLSISNLLHNPAIGGVVINARDISHSRQLQEQLQYQAEHDLLTGLPNRAVGHERLRARLAGKGAGAVAVLFVDLDGFKAVNDSLGHDIGDELLRKVAWRISAAVRGRDTVARVGGDEFMVLLDAGVDRTEVDVAAARIVDAVSEPLEIRGHLVRVGASVGVSMALPGESADDVLRAADKAMYHAKRAGGGRVQVYAVNAA
jgi:diguanylate cyclase (GGDEF)-like protein/PAS domain S-box-containing protein